MYGFTFVSARTIVRCPQLSRPAAATSRGAPARRAVSGGRIRCGFSKCRTTPTARPPAKRRGGNTITRGWSRAGSLSAGSATPILAPHELEAGPGRIEGADLEVDEARRQTRRAHHRLRE